MTAGLSSNAPSAGLAAGDLARSPARDSVFTLLVILLAALVLWHSAGDHALYPPDEGRYASASQTMARGGSWLIPEFEGKPHLTKPPLTYWLQALSVRVMGETEAAVRAPSLVAATLTLLLTALFAARVWSLRVGAISAAILGVTPLHLIMGRLASTDALLCLFWTAALFAGALRFIERRRAWLVPMWLAVALAILAKGPLGLTPVGLLILWHALARRWRDIAGLWIPIGLPLAILPALAWAFAVAQTHPDAIEIWRHEVLDRTTGSGDHPEPIWYFIPIFIGGLFPASALLTLPGLNFPLRDLSPRLRAGGVAALLALAVALPFVMFSFIAGKLASYLLPLAPPLATLAALSVDRLLPDSAVDRAPDALRRLSPSKPPAVALGLLIGLSVMALAAIGAAVLLSPAFLPQAVVFALLPILAIWLARVWRRQPPARPAALLAVWISMTLGWWWAFEIEDDIRKPSDASRLVEDLRLMTAPDQPVVYRFGTHDPTISFYLGRDPTRVGWSAERIRAVVPLTGPAVLLADADIWSDVCANHPDLPRKFVQVGAWRHWPSTDVLILRPRAVVEAEGAASQP